MLIYGKRVEVTTTTPHKFINVLYGTTGTIPSTEDKPIVYQNAEGTNVDPTVVVDYKFFYNKDGGIEANTSLRQIPSGADATDAVVLNTFIEDASGTLYPVVITNDFGYTVSISATGDGTVAPTSAVVKLGEDSPVFTVTPDPTTATITSITLDPTTGYTAEVSSTDGTIKFVDVVSNISVTATIVATEASQTPAQVSPKSSSKKTTKAKVEEEPTAE